MKQCISRIKLILIHLWQTLKEYVCKKSHNQIKFYDYDNDNYDEIIIDFNGSPNHEEVKNGKE